MKGDFTPRPLARSYQEEKEVNNRVVEVVDSQQAVAMHYSPSSDSYVPECNQGGEITPAIDDWKIRKNKRLKLGVVKLPTITDAWCLDAGKECDGLLPQMQVLQRVKGLTADVKIVLSAIIELDGAEFCRSDLTRALKNKMKAQEIKYFLEQLVRKGLLKELPTTPDISKKGGRPKAEEYELLFDKDTIQLTDLDAEL
ncbi:protein of unknown function [Pseudodesulfovibrio profundus]|uniref:Uncharacterized protein n=1 Tax=Pseudodesulfovibrio profundus TaxID=57320 RepID=A0A2C8F8W8_9BACT|nr:hypothetical protein [Pseudodesulfovibrio profundus]SOB58955.1 protein of unknown function [Pseudodesulfovibrio profundus]